MQDSLVNFTQMILDACYATLQVEEDMVWGKDVINSPYRSVSFLASALLLLTRINYLCLANLCCSIGLFDSCDIVDVSVEQSWGFMEPRKFEQ